MGGIVTSLIGIAMTIAGALVNYTKVMSASKTGGRGEPSPQGNTVVLAFLLLIGVILLMAGIAAIFGLEPLSMLP